MDSENNVRMYALPQVRKEQGDSCGPLHALPCYQLEKGEMQRFSQPENRGKSSPKAPPPHFRTARKPLGCGNSCIPSGFNIIGFQFRVKGVFFSRIFNVKLPEFSMQ